MSHLITIVFLTKALPKHILKVWKLLFVYTSMKVFFPRNIPWGWLNMSVQMWPAQVSIIQLMLLAIWMWIGLAVANAFIRNGSSRAVWLLVALPIFIIFVIIAFFRYSELRIHEFLAKMIRTNMLDTTKKYQLNRSRPDPVALALSRARKTEHDTLIQQKDLILDKETLDRFNLLDADETQTEELEK